MKNGGKNKSVAFIIFFCVYIYIYIYSGFCSISTVTQLDLMVTNI